MILSHKNEYSVALGNARNKVAHGVRFPNDNGGDE